MIKNVVSKTKGLFRKKQLPALFHITNYKAGSQWIYGILREAFPKNKVVKPLPKVAHILEAKELKEGFIYPTVYLERHVFLGLPLPKNYKYFVLFRDLRDVLVSLYFSMKKSHPGDFPAIKNTRQYLEELDDDEGIMWVLENRLGANAKIQSSWVEKGEEFIRYEELLENDVEILTDVFLNKLKLPIEKSVLENAIINNRFEKLAKGRKPGEEDQSSHYRKGVKGDWENYFTDAIKARFKEKYGQLLIDTGYEKDLNW